jgi:hypothetical protein
MEFPLLHRMPTLPKIIMTMALMKKLMLKRKSKEITTKLMTKASLLMIKRIHKSILKDRKMKINIQNIRTMTPKILLKLTQRTKKRWSSHQRLKKMTNKIKIQKVLLRLKKIQKDFQQLGVQV